MERGGEEKGSREERRRGGGEVVRMIVTLEQHVFIMSCALGGYPQSKVEGPGQSSQLDQQVEEEPAVVLLPDTVLYPGAVVVKLAHTPLTRLAMLRSHWLLLQRGRDIETEWSLLDLSKFYENFWQQHKQTL